jgi:hypothetical protein
MQVPHQVAVGVAIKLGSAEGDPMKLYVKNEILPRKGIYPVTSTHVRTEMYHWPNSIQQHHFTFFRPHTLLF